MNRRAWLISTPLMVLGAYLVQVLSSWGGLHAMAVAFVVSLPVAFLV